MSKILLAVVGVFLALVTAEAALRLFVPVTTIKWRDDPVVGRRLKANQSGMFVAPSGEYKTPITVNSQGFRDSEHSFQKPGGTKRVLILGDSFVENFQVPLEETFFKQLETGDGKLEIIPMGLGDSGTAQQLILLKQYGLKYNPDIVLHFFFTGNDVKNNSPALMGDPHRPYFALENGELKKTPFKTLTSTPAGKIKSLIKNNSRLAAFLFDAKGKLDRRKNSGVPVDYQVYVPEYTKEYNEAWEVTKKLIVETKNASEKAGAAYILVSLANKEQLAPQILPSGFDPEKPDTVLREFCEKEKMDCLFMLPFFKSFLADNKSLNTHHSRDGHWNEVGTTLAAKFLTQIFKNE